MNAREFADRFKEVLRRWLSPRTCYAWTID